MRILVLVILAVVLVSCQSLKTKTSKTQAFKWSEINSWAFTGKMAINDGHNSGSGKINWKINQGQLLAQFKAPLGQGSWEIEENTQGAHLTSSRNPEQFANDAQTLISNELGWLFPLEKLKYWLRGYAHLAPLEPHQIANQNIKDAGWEITYQKWQTTKMGLLPFKIKANKSPHSLKLIIYKWTFD